jgi:hypothetical protein
MVAESLPIADRDRLIAEWGETLDQMDAARSVGAAELVLIEYRERIERRLAATRRRPPRQEVVR